MLSGHVSTKDVAKRAAMIAEAYSKNVVNVLTFGPVGQEVLLEVKFAEVDRSAVTQLGVNCLPRRRKHHRNQQHGSIRRSYHYAADVAPRPPASSTTSNDADTDEHQSE